ncbi:MAG: DUF47 family protein [Ignavibacteriae bacterium]|nr:MAG: DUF47 family protein [Ignavibacteriota bacterium]
MLKRFLPKQEKFYDSLNEMAESILKAANLLNDMILDHERHTEYSSKIHLLENVCDDMTHTIIGELNETFITPIDREDIYELTNSMDNIIDSIDVIASRYNLYKIKNPMPYGPQLVSILLKQVETLCIAISELKNNENIFEKLVLIRNLETQGDIVFREAIGSLFELEKDPIELIKKKETLENIERAVDKCQTATIVIESILIKYV